MNGTIDATSTKQAFIRGIHNGSNRQCRNVVSDDFDATHRLCLRHTASLARGGGRFNGNGGYAGAVPKTVPNPEPLSAKTSPTSTKLGRENLNKTPKFPFVFGRC